MAGCPRRQARPHEVPFGTKDLAVCVAENSFCTHKAAEPIMVEMPSTVRGLPSCCFADQLTQTKDNPRETFLERPKNIAPDYSKKPNRPNQHLGGGGG